MCEIGNVLQKKGVFLSDKNASHIYFVYMQNTNNTTNRTATSTTPGTKIGTKIILSVATFAAIAFLATKHNYRLPDRCLPFAGLAFILLKYCTTKMCYDILGRDNEAICEYESIGISGTSFDAYLQLIYLKRCTML